MRLSARNQLPDTVPSIDRDPVHSRLKIDIGGALVVTSVISTEAVDDLKLASGSKRYAIVKASSVMVGSIADASLVACQRIENAELHQLAHRARRPCVAFDH